MSATVLQIRGQKLYREKNYEAALEAFNSAIRLSSQSTISILDNRAAAHEKLGDFQAALRDGKRIIDQQKSEARGYLRVGKVLQLMEKEELARNIYQRGASNVAPNDPQYKILQLLMAMLEKVSGNLRSRATNPLLVLPPELLEMIALQLDFKSLT
ncbi:MAG: hypothetical protein M4579_002894 [Chaenotheca gracillima]|nr:MAG: hypothetical protein M4579_002894 [Chaenotheca gracillima]